MRLCPKSVSNMRLQVAASGNCWRHESQQSQCFDTRYRGFRFRYRKVWRFEPSSSHSLKNRGFREIAGCDRAPETPSCDRTVSKMAVGQAVRP